MLRQSTQISLPEKQQNHREVLFAILQRLQDRNQTIADAISERDLYFRVSVLTNCNLSCRFCHHEGGISQGFMELEFARQAVDAAFEIGFRRIQFTGGEPLLRKDIGDFVALARERFVDVGVTTNGTFLPARIDALRDSGIQRIHVSLQDETLSKSGVDGAWGVPDWLVTTLEFAHKGEFHLRINLPVPSNKLGCVDIFTEAISMPQ